MFVECGQCKTQRGVAQQGMAADTTNAGGVWGDRSGELTVVITHWRQCTIGRGPRGRGSRERY